MNEYRAPEPTMIPSNFYMSADRRASALRHRHGQIIVYSCVIRSRCNNPINMDVFLLSSPGPGLLRCGGRRANNRTAPTLPVINRAPAKQMHASRNRPVCIWHEMSNSV